MTEPKIGLTLTSAAQQLGRGNEEAPRRAKTVQNSGKGKEK
tara:strand:+ start:3162 stop:3284 length:123 start_codon:yes stop_codon:yes gene_type:complete